MFADLAGWEATPRGVLAGSRVSPSAYYERCVIE